jgi:ABC-type molybdate transport system substrate-binding protein
MFTYIKQNNNRGSKMKKLLCLVFSLMVAVMAAGCGGGDKQAAAPQAGKTLRLAAAASMEKVFTQKLIPLYKQKRQAAGTD